MQREKQLNARLLVTALIIAALLFGAGLVAGFTISRERVSDLEEDVRDVIRDVQNFQLQFLFFDVLGDNATCPLLADTILSINQKSFQISEKLAVFESGSEIKDEATYTTLKQDYSRLLIGYWLLANKLQQACHSDVKTVIYFYENTCDLCADQAFVLNYLKQEYPDTVLIFTLDGRLEEASVKTIKEYYHVDSFPTLIIDGVPYPGFQSLETLKETIGLE
ncbi:MAG: conjugal transfer protein TraF [Nanoarchaeota archaeon]|nr:conjugal transfer protein TraF [Nanoarchaeota archaeon]